MNTMCAWCKKPLNEFNDDMPISHGICDSCSFHVRAQIGMPAQQYIAELPVPVVIVAPPEGFVVGANVAGRELLGKSDDQIVGFLGGEVFECDYSYLPKGCGQTQHCGACAIRRAVITTHETGEALAGHGVTLHQRTPGGVHDVRLTISTQKIGEVVFLRIDG